MNARLRSRGWKAAGPERVWHKTLTPTDVFSPLIPSLTSVTCAPKNRAPCRTRWKAGVSFVWFAFWRDRARDARHGPGHRGGCGDVQDRRPKQDLGRASVEFGRHRGLRGRRRGRPEGSLTLGDLQLEIVPAHFLHSPGNFQLYDPVSKILYSGDLGASLGNDYTHVTDFDAHVPFMKGFHERYMASERAMKAWARRARKLDIETIAPQHGAMLSERRNVERFIDWAASLPCGTDLIPA